MLSIPPSAQMLSSPSQSGWRSHQVGRLLPHRARCRTCCTTCNIRNGVNSYVARLPIDGVARRQFIKAPDVGFGLCAFEDPTCGSPGGRRVRNEPGLYFSHARCARAGLDAPGRSWTRSHLLLVHTRFSVLHRHTVLSNEVQGCSRKTKNDHRVTHETNTCVFSVNFQHDSHFQCDRIRFTVLTRDRALDAKRERLKNT